MSKPTFFIKAMSSYKNIKLDQYRDDNDGDDDERQCMDVICMCFCCYYLINLH